MLNGENEMRALTPKHGSYKTPDEELQIKHQNIKKKWKGITHQPTEHLYKGIKGEGGIERGKAYTK